MGRRRRSRPARRRTPPPRRTASNGASSTMRRRHDRHHRRTVTALGSAGAVTTASRSLCVVRDGVRALPTLAQFGLMAIQGRTAGFAGARVGGDRAPGRLESPIDRKDVGAWGRRWKLAGDDRSPSGRTDRPSGPIVATPPPSDHRPPCRRRPCSRDGWRARLTASSEAEAREPRTESAPPPFRPDVGGRRGCHGRVHRLKVCAARPAPVGVQALSGCRSSCLSGRSSRLIDRSAICDWAIGVLRCSVALVNSLKGEILWRLLVLQVAVPEWVLAKPTSRRHPIPPEGGRPAGRPRTPVR